MKRVMFWLAVAWRQFAQGVNLAVLFYLQKSNPKYMVAAFLAMNFVIAAMAYFLTASWNDFYTVSGYWVTLTGFFVAIGELYRTHTITDHLRAALTKEKHRQQSHHYKYCLQRAKSSPAEAQAHVLGYRWLVAVVRLNDLMENLSYIDSINPTADNRWKTLAQSAQVWAGVFADGQNTRKLSYAAASWHQFALSAVGHLNSELAPFQFGEEVDNAAEQ